MFLVGLTGGIGSGKSTVAELLRGRGWPVVDADQVAREVVEPGGAVLAELATHFGAHVLRADGSLDRQALARVAFADDVSRAALERLTHPAIGARITERVTALAEAHRGPTPLIAVVDHPLLIETAQTDRFDAVVVVLAADAVRIARLTTDRELDVDDARARMRAQTDDARRRALATHVVTNDGTPAELERAVADVAGRIEEAALAEERGS